MYLFRVGFLSFSSIADRSYEVRSDTYYKGLLDKVSISFVLIIYYLLYRHMKGAFSQ